MTRRAIFIAVDNSASLAGKVAEARIAVSEFIEGIADAIELSGEDLDIGLCFWGAEADTRVWRKVSSAGVGAALASVARLDAGGGVSDYSSFAADALAFFEETETGPVYTSRVMVFVSAGPPDDPATADAAAATLADVLDDSALPFASFTAVRCYAASFADAETTHPAKLDNTTGGDIPEVALSSRALASFLRAAALPETSWDLWSWPVQWDQGFEEERAFRTEIITSRDGTEQRIAQRINPRVHYEFESLLRGASFREATARFSRDQGRKFFVPHPADPVTVESAAAPGALYLPVSAVPGWYAPGVPVVVSSRLSTPLLLRTVGADGSGLRLATPLSQEVPQGARVRLAVHGRFDGAMNMTLESSGTARATVAFDGDPVSTPHAVVEAAAVTVDGMELLGVRPNWASRMRLAIEQPVEVMDFDRGATGASFPIDRSYRTREATFSGTAATVADVLGLFYRCRGRQKRLLLPMWADELKLAAAAGPTATEILVEGQDPERAFAMTPGSRYVFLRTPSGPHVVPVSQVYAQGDNTRLLLADVLGVNLLAGATAMWALPARLASDRITIKWATNAVAEITLTFTTLEGEV